MSIPAGCPDNSSARFTAPAGAGVATAYTASSAVPVALSYSPSRSVPCAAGTGMTGGGSSVPGCMDPAALNYNPLATVDDGSCVFNPSHATPVFIRPLNEVYLPSSAATFPGIVSSTGGGEYSIGYLPVAVPTDSAGNTTLQATLANGELVPALNVSLTAGKYYSWVLWRDAAGVLHSDLLDDNYDPLATTGTLRLIQLFAARLAGDTVVPALDELVTVNIGFSSQFPNGNAIAEDLPYGSFTTVSGVRLPTDPDGADAGISFVGQPGDKTWNAEMYFGDSRQNTVFIIPDPYGRFRPRVARDGPFLPS